MIKSRLEARSLRIWLFCTVVFISAALIAARVIGFYSEELFYKWLPFLDFNLVINGSVFGKSLPGWFTDNFSFEKRPLHSKGLL